MLFEEIVAAVRDQGGLDASDQVRGAWVNEVHRTACAKSKWLMQSLVLGVTVAGTAAYSIPADVAEVDGLYLDGAEGPSDYRRVGTTDLWDLRAGRSFLTGSGGVFAPQYSGAASGASAAATKQVELYPAPVESGVDIVVLAAMIPEALVNGEEPSIPVDMHGDLLDGAISLGIARLDERLDSASAYAAKFAQMVDELGRRKNRRVGGEPQRIKLFGADWR